MYDYILIHPNACGYSRGRARSRYRRVSCNVYHSLELTTTFTFRMSKVPDDVSAVLTVTSVHYLTFLYHVSVQLRPEMSGM